MNIIKEFIESYSTTIVDFMTAPLNLIHLFTYFIVTSILRGLFREPTKVKVVK